MSQKSPHRNRFNFWLNLDKPDEEKIADTIEHLKTERSFTKTIRDGIRLIVDLRKGNTEVLFELFPDLESRLGGSSGSSGDDDSDIKREIDNLKQLIISQTTNSNTHIMSEQPKPSGLQSLGGVKQLNAPQFDKPSYDDDEDDDLGLVVTKAVSDGQASLNFLASMNALQQ